MLNIPNMYAEIKSVLATKERADMSHMDFIQQSKRFDINAGNWLRGNARRLRTLFDRLDEAATVSLVGERYAHGNMVEVQLQLASEDAPTPKIGDKFFTFLPEQVVSDAAPRANLYLDLDGVMADFDGAFPTVFGLDHRDMADDEMWLHINAHATFFRDLPLMPGALDFFRSIEHLNPIILTACPKSNYPHVAAQKRAWVREHLSDHVQVLPVLGGRHKPLFMHTAGDVLIDDFRKNTEAWSAAGGIAILHRNFNDTRTALEAALGVKS